MASLSKRMAAGLFGLAILASLAISGGQAQRCGTVPTHKGTRFPAECVFPFKYKGGVYSFCTDVDDPKGKLWCSVKVDKNGTHVPRRWGHCDPRTCKKDRETDPDDTFACGTTIIIDREKSGIRLAPGAENAQVGAWPWMASAGHLDQKNNWIHKCGGTLISPMFVLTAAHCALAAEPKWVLIFGDTDLSTRSDDFDVATRRIDRSHFHPKWDRSGPYYDVAFWEVRPITFGLYVRPICLPENPTQDHDSNAGKAAETMGWGTVGKGSLHPSNILKSTSLRIYQNRYCNDTFREYPNAGLVRERYPNLFADGLLCAGAPTGTRGTCFGDSGGPLVTEEIYPTRRYVQIGVVQGGVGRCGSAHFPDVFVRLEDPDVFDFVLDTVGEDLPRRPTAPTTTTTTTTTTTEAARTESSATIFSCTSTSRNKIYSGPVSFEECPVVDGSLNPETGVFTAPEDGTYSLSLNALMNSEYGYPLSVRMEEYGGRVVHARRAISGPAEWAAISVSTVLSRPVRLRRGEEVAFVVEAKQPSGITTAPSRTLKLVGRRIPGVLLGKTCLGRDNCRDHELFVERDPVPPGDKIYMRIRFGGEALLEADDEIFLALVKYRTELVDGNIDVPANVGPVLGTAANAVYTPQTESEYKAELQKQLDLEQSATAFAALKVDTPSPSVAKGKRTRVPIGNTRIVEFNVDHRYLVSPLSTAQPYPNDQATTSFTSHFMESTYVLLEPLPFSSEVASCVPGGAEGEADPVGFVRCSPVSRGFRRAIDLTAGTFTAPSDGHYEVTFDGLLESDRGFPVWVSLHKQLKADGDGLPEVLATAFLNMQAVGADGEAFYPKIKATASFETVEFLSRGDSLSLVLEGWDGANGRLVGGRSGNATNSFTVRSLD